MSHRLVMAATFIGLGILLSGCGGGEDPAGPTAVAPPPPAPTTDGGTAAGNNTPPADNTAGQEDMPTDNAPDASANGGEDAGGGDAAAGKMVAAEGPLAPHAKALSIVQPDHYAIFRFNMLKARQAKLLQDLPGDPEAMLRELDGPREAGDVAEMLTDVDEFWLSIGPLANELAGPGAPPFGLGAYARFKTEEALKQRTDEFGTGRMEEATHGGVKYFRPQQVGRGPIYFSDGLDLFLSTDEATIKNIIDAKGKIADIPLLDNLKTAPFDADVMIAGSLGPMREPTTEMLTNLITESGLPLAPTSGELPAQIDYGTIAINLDGDPIIDIDMDMDKAGNAGVMRDTLNGLVSLGKIVLGQQASQLPDDPAARQGFNLVLSLLDAIKVDTADAHVDLSLARVDELDKLPEILAAAQGAANENNAMMNGRYLGIAALNHKDATRQMPANHQTEAGEELLSWRVALLPYLEENILYDQIDRQAAWDSAANAELTANPIPVFTASGVEDLTLTRWKMVPHAAGGMLFIEAGAGTEVPWAKPDSFEIDPADPSAALGEEPEGGFIVVFDDGHIEKLTTAQIAAKVASGPKPSIEGPTPPVDVPDPEPEVDPEPGPDTDPLTDPPAPEPEARPVRTWTTADGKNSVEASFVKLVGDKVTLRRADNEAEVTLPVSVLSDADQEELKSLRK